MPISPHSTPFKLSIGLSHPSAFVFCTPPRPLRARRLCRTQKAVLSTWHYQNPCFSRTQLSRTGQLGKVRPRAHGSIDTDDYLSSYDSDDYNSSQKIQLGPGLGLHVTLLDGHGAHNSSEQQQQQHHINHNSVPPQQQQQQQQQQQEDIPGSRSLSTQEEDSEAPGVFARFRAALWAIWLSASAVPGEIGMAVRVTAGGFVGVIVAFLQSLLGRLKGTTAHRVTTRVKRDWAHAPRDTWGRIQWLWDQPILKQVRITLSMAQWTVRLPALLALVATQMGFLASQVSLPMLAPLLLGTGMLLRSIRANASFVFPRIGLLVVLMWVLWFANSVVQSTCVYLRRQGAIDGRISGAIITTSECAALLAAGIIVLSMLGVNVSALLLPAGIALAFAAKDLSHNFLAGFFLFAVQPFKLGDRVAVSYSSPAVGGGPPNSAWFEGIAEKTDLRYTVIKNGQRRLFMPNAAFITREFMVVDGPERRIPRAGRRGSKTDAVHDRAAAQGRAQAVSGPSDRPVWLNSPPYSDSGMADHTPAPAQRVPQRVPSPRLSYVDRHGAELPPAPHSWPPSEPAPPSQQLHGYPGNGPPAAAPSPMQPSGPLQNNYPPPAPAMGPTCPWPTAGPTQPQHAPPPSFDSQPATGNGQPKEGGNTGESQHLAATQPGAPGTSVHANSQQHPRSHPVSRGPDPQYSPGRSPAGPQGPSGHVAPAQSQESGRSPAAAADGHQGSQAAADHDPVSGQSNASPTPPAHSPDGQPQTAGGSASSHLEQYSTAAAQGWPLQYPMGYPSSAAGQAHDRWQQQQQQQPEHMQGRPVGEAHAGSSSARVAGYASLGYGSTPPAAAAAAAASLWLDNGHGYLWNQQTGQWATVNPIPPLQTPFN